MVVTQALLRRPALNPLGLRQLLTKTVAPPVVRYPLARPPFQLFKMSTATRSSKRQKTNDDLPYRLIYCKYC